MESTLPGALFLAKAACLLGSAACLTWLAIRWRMLDEERDPPRWIAFAVRVTLGLLLVTGAGWAIGASGVSLAIAIPLLLSAGLVGGFLLGERTCGAGPALAAAAMLAVGLGSGVAAASTLGLPALAAGGGALLVGAALATRQDWRAAAACSYAFPAGLEPLVVAPAEGRCEFCRSTTWAASSGASTTPIACPACKLTFHAFDFDANQWRCPGCDGALPSVTAEAKSRRR